jgi:charged multivesicular body protein 4
MPSFGGLFGKKDKSGGSSSSSAQKGPVDVNSRLQQMQDAEETLRKREMVLTKRMETELQAARTAQQKGNKTVALRHLKQKKAYEEQLGRLSGQMTNMQTMMLKIEEAQTGTVTMSALAGGAQGLESIQKNMSVEKVEDVMAKVQEATDLANEGLAALSQPIGGEMYDDDDLLAELDELDEQELDEQMMGLSSPAGKLPQQAAPKPGVKQAAAAAAQDDDLEELERMMNA